MTIVYRMFPSPKPQYQTLSFYGRSYTGVPGTFQDVEDSDAQMLEANGWSRVAQVGPTASRPAATVNPGVPTRGDKYFDTTVGDMIVFDGLTWRSPITGAAV